MYRRLSVWGEKKRSWPSTRKENGPCADISSTEPIEKNRVFMGDPPPPAGCGRMELEEGGGGCLSFDAHSSSSSPTHSTFWTRSNLTLSSFSTPRLDLNIFLSVHHCAAHNRLVFPPQNLFNSFTFTFDFIYMYVCTCWGD